MIVVALQETEKKGKTDTLKRLINLFKDIGGVSLVEEKVAIKDQWAVFDYFGKKIGITTRGESEQCIDDDFKDMGECDIYVCAVHSSGKTVDLVKKADEWYIYGRLTLESSNKSSEPAMQYHLNDSQARMLFDEILKII